MQTHFPQENDIKLVYRLLHDFTRRFFPMVPYRKLLTTPREVDDIHGEVQDSQKRFSEWIPCRMFVVPTQITQPLSKFAVEETRDIEINISVPNLVEAGLAQQAPTYDTLLLTSGIGDRVEYHQQVYEIQTFAPSIRWANTDLILYYTGRATLYRMEADKVQ